MKYTEENIKGLVFQVSKDTYTIDIDHIGIF